MIEGWLSFAITKYLSQARRKMKRNEKYESYVLLNITFGRPVLESRAMVERVRTAVIPQSKYS